MSQRRVGMTAHLEALAEKAQRIAELEADNERLSKLADVSIEANVEADGLRSERDRAVADGVLMKAQMQSAAQYAVGVAAERDMAMDDGAALRGALEKLAWETVVDKGGSEASECRLCGGVLDHVPDCILSTGHPGAGVMAVVTAARKVRSIATWIERHPDSAEDIYSCAIEEMKSREVVLDNALAALDKEEMGDV